VAHRQDRRRAKFGGHGVVTFACRTIAASRPIAAIAVAS
jgi:hypothetical protein